MGAYNKTGARLEWASSKGRQIIEWIIKAGGELIKFFGINALKILYNVLKVIGFRYIFT